MVAAANACWAKLSPLLLLQCAELQHRATEIDLAIHRAALTRLRQMAGGTQTSLNVSARSMSNSSGVNELLAIARQVPEPSLLVYEITETACMRDASEGHRFCASIRETGCRVALDDACTTHGALALDRRWIDIVKFSILGLETQQILPQLRTAVRLTQDRGQIVVLEGIEHEHQLDCALELGVEYVQGFIYEGKPRLF